MTVKNKGRCCCSCPTYTRLDAGFSAGIPYTDPPQSIRNATINCYNGGSLVATYSIGTSSGDHIEDYQTGFTDLPVYLNGDQVGTLTWQTQNTDTSIFGHKLNQGTLTLKLTGSGGPFQYPPAGRIEKRESWFRCEYKAEGVSLNRYQATGLNIAGDVSTE